MSNFYSNVFRALPGLACVLDPSGLMCDANANFEKEFRMTKNAVMSTKMENLFARHSDRVCFDFAFGKMRSGEVHEFGETDMITKEGK